MKNIGILGSQSFIARNFIKYCEKREDYRFKLYDISDNRGSTKWEYHKIDFSDLESIETIDFDVDDLFVFIGMTGTVRGFKDYGSFININEYMLLNILNVYKEKKSQARIIYPSTRLIYKSNDGLTKEDSPLEMKSIYAVTKYAAEQYLKIYKDVFRIESVILRICTPIGTLLDDCGNYGTFEIFERQIKEKKKITVYGTGEQKKTFTDMSDICKAFCKLVDAKKIERQDYNLGGQQLSLLDIARYIAKDNYEIEHVDWPRVDWLVDGGSIVFDSSRFDAEFNMIYRDIISHEI